MTKVRSHTRIKVLAFCHRYGWLVAMVLIMYLTNNVPFVMGVGLIIHAIWTLIGYSLRWKHIYCSYQNAYRMDMTPDNVRWSIIRKTDAYGIPAIFAAIGTVILLINII